MSCRYCVCCKTCRHACKTLHHCHQNKLDKAYKYHMGRILEPSQIHKLPSEILPAASSNTASAIEHPLNTQVDIISNSMPSNFDTICQSRQCTVSPARPTVLWNVLIQRMRQERMTRNVPPVPRFWKIFLGNIPKGKNPVMDMLCYYKACLMSDGTTYS